MSVSIELLSPRPGAVRVSPDAPLVMAFSAPGETFTSTSVYVNGLRVYHNTGSPAFTYPEAFGEVVVGASAQQVTLRLRRRHSAVVPVTVEASAATNVTELTVVTAKFWADPADRSRGGAPGRVDSPFRSYALELFRQAALGASGASSPSAAGALVHRVKSSSLASLIPGSAVAAEAPQERVSRLAAAADELRFLWPRAEEELAGLGVPPETVAALGRGLVADYPQERAGALALTVLIAADRPNV